jgi:hypothetical protein
MKTFMKFFFLFFGLGLFSACSSVKSVTSDINANSELIIGNWDIGKISLTEPTQNDNTTHRISEKNKPIEATDDANLKNQKKEFADKVNSIQSFLPGVKSALEFRKDKTATYTFKDNVVNGIWEIDRTGKTVTFTGNDGSGPTIFNIIFIDSQRLQVIERFPKEEVNINYLKK